MMESSFKILEAVTEKTCSLNFVLGTKRCAARGYLKDAGDLPYFGIFYTITHPYTWPVHMYTDCTHAQTVQMHTDCTHAHRLYTCTQTVHNHIAQ